MLEDGSYDLSSQGHLDRILSSIYHLTGPISHREARSADARLSPWNPLEHTASNSHPQDGRCKQKTRYTHQDGNNVS